MALLGQRNEHAHGTDITKINVSAATRGVILCHYTSGSGAGIGDTAGSVSKSASASGAKVAGLLLNDQVSLDETLYERSRQKDVMLVNERCTLGRQGTWYTDEISGSPAVGDTAYLTANGQVTPTMSATGGLVATPKVGQFSTIKNENGFAGLELNLPVI